MYTTPSDSLIVIRSSNDNLLNRKSVRNTIYATPGILQHKSVKFDRLHKVQYIVLLGMIIIFIWLIVFRLSPLQQYTQPQTDDQNDNTIDMGSMNQNQLNFLQSQAILQNLTDINYNQLNQQVIQQSPLHQQNIRQSNNHNNNRSPSVKQRITPLTPVQLKLKPSYLSTMEYQQFISDRNKFISYAVYDPINDPIDLVYTWVNGSIPEFIELRNSVLVQLDGHQLPDAAHMKRFRSERNELLYSLRSVQKYMAWIRHIYLVVSPHHIPYWLNINHPQIKLITHNEIYSNTDYLPTFNSVAIETQLQYIPGLSQNYIYMNDDIILFQPWSVTDFISTNSEYVLYFSPYQFMSRHHNTVDQCQANDAVAGQLMYSDRLLYDRGLTRIRYPAAHTPIMYNKHILQQLSIDYSHAWQNTISHQFRTHNELQLNSFYNWYLQESNIAYTYADKYSVNLYQISDDLVRNNQLISTLDELIEHNIRQITFNDDLEQQECIYIADTQLIQWFNHQFPDKSVYEL